MRPISSTSFFIASISGPLAEQRQLELEARQDRAQVVRHAGEHRGALLHRALDAALHLDEGLRGAAHLARAARPEARHLAALAEAFGGVGEAQDRPDLVAQEQDRDARAAPARCRPSRAGRSPSSTHRRRCAARTRASRCRRAGCGSRPGSSARPCRSRTGGGSARADLLRQRLVEQREERLRPGRRHFGRGQEIDRQAEPLLRDRAG